MNASLPLLTALLLTLLAVRANETTLSYDKPASNWMTEALPVGNGELGAMVYGGTEIERVQFNEKSLGTGFDNRPAKRARPGLPILDGTKDAYLSLRVSDKPVFGYYARRSNDDATIRGMPLVIDGAWFDRGVSFEAPNDFSFSLGAKYQWLTFHARVEEVASLQIILDGKVVREITASKAGQYTAIPVSGVKTLTIKGASRLDPNDKTQPEILLGHLRVCPANREPEKDEGVVRGWNSRPGFDALIPPAALAFEKCDSLTILLSAKTSYLADSTRGWRGAHPHEVLTALLDKAASRPFSDLLAAHEKDFGALFSRVSLELGKKSPQVANLPTDERLKRYAEGNADPGLEELSFQFGRHLLIACSRAGGLPANLQGVWNTSTLRAWRGAYHSNIDLEMCYWSAEATGLGECHVPFTDFIATQAPTYRANMQRDPEMAKRFAGHRGWTIRTETGVFGASSWELNTSAKAWYCHRL